MQTSPRRWASKQAREWYKAYDDAVDAVERIVRKEAIDCGFVRTGKLKLATRPAHLEALARSAERLIGDGVDCDVEILDRARVRAEVASDRFVGGLLIQTQRPDARVAASRMVWRKRPSGAARRSARGSCVQRVERIGRGHAHRVHTDRGTVHAQQVLLAIGAARHGSYSSFGWLRRRIVPIGSFIIATEPLGAARAEALLRERRTYVTVANIHHYFSVTPDHRLVFGGRARFSVSNPGSDARSGDILRDGMLRDFSVFARRGNRLLLGWPRRHDARPSPARRRARRPVLFDRLQRTRHANVGADGRAHGRSDGWRHCGQSVARSRMAGDPGAYRTALVPARRRALLPPEGSLRLKPPSLSVPDVTI